MNDAIVLTDMERSAGTLAAEVADQALRAFQSNGFVVFENVIEPSILADLRSSYLEELDEKVRRSGLAPVQVAGAADRHERVTIRFEPKGGNHDVNRWNMHLPSRQPFLDPRLLAGPAVLDVIGALFTDPVLFLIASDTPFPGSTYQNIHQDFARFGVTVNVPLVDFTEQNGPIEVWPGTHLRDPSARFSKWPVWHEPEALAALVESVPGRRLLLRAGSILIRDQRLVHRGTHNASSEPRPALSLWFASPKQPAPHRFVANLCGSWARRERRRARSSGAVADVARANKGNLAGRIVDEWSNSDRDRRRPVPRSVWEELPAPARRALRYAQVQGHRPERADRSWRADLDLVRHVASTLRGSDPLS